MATKKDEAKAGVEPGKEVVDWQARMEGEAKEAAALERPSIASIGLRSGVMTYQSQPIPGNTLDCIIAEYAFENRWYPGGFDPNNIQSPDCFALSSNGEDMAPHANSKDPQHSVCKGCQLLAWGSAAGTSRGKACGEIRRLIILPVTELTPGSINKSEAALMKVSVTNVKHWSTYVNKLAASYHRPPWAVISTISVTPDPKSQFKISFDERELITDSELLAAIAGRQDALRAIALNPYEEFVPGSDEDKAPAPKEDTKY